MSLQEKYQAILDLANENGTTYELSGDDSVLHIDGAAPSEDAKAALWAKYEELDPEYRSGDLVLNITTGAGDAGGGNTYTVESGDNLSKIGAKYGVSWKAIFDANRDILSDPDMIHPGQELKIP